MTKHKKAPASKAVYAQNIFAKAPTSSLQWKTWDEFFAMMKTIDIPEEFLLDRRDLIPQKREFFG